MAHGYSVRLTRLNAEADQTRLGVRLGKKCIAANISVHSVAKMLGVSRQTVYSWFCGFYTPQNASIGPIEDFMATL